MNRIAAALCAVVLALSVVPVVAQPAPVVVVNHPGWPIFASAIDQPELSAVLVDPATGQVVMDPVYNTESVFDAFIDTGASGVVISKLNAEGYYYGMGMGDILSLNLDEATMSQGDWNEYGIGGTETGWISPLRHLRIANGVPGQEAFDPAVFQPFQLDGGLWVRKNIGVGENFIFSMDPVNVIGMPVIKNTVMVMDPTPLDQDIWEGPRVITRLLTDRNDPSIPATNATIPVVMADFTAGAAGAGLAAAQNPVIPNITLKHTAGATTEIQQDWLFDTGSGSTFLSFAAAQSLGLIGPQYTSLADYVANGSPERTTMVGGIGESTLTVPILTLDEIRLPTKEGFDLAFQDVDVLVLDIQGLDGVLGMNLLMPSLTITLGDLPVNFSDVLNELYDPELWGSLGLPAMLVSDPKALDLEFIISPRIFDAIVFDPQAGELRLASQNIPEPATLALLLGGWAAAMLRRRR